MPGKWTGGEESALPGWPRQQQCPFHWKRSEAVSLEVVHAMDTFSSRIVFRCCSRSCPAIIPITRHLKCQNDRDMISFCSTHPPLCTFVLAPPIIYSVAYGNIGIPSSRTCYPIKTYFPTNHYISTCLVYGPLWYFQLLGVLSIFQLLVFLMAWLISRRETVIGQGKTEVRLLGRMEMGTA